MRRSITAFDTTVRNTLLERNYCSSPFIGLKSSFISINSTTGVGESCLVQIDQYNGYAAGGSIEVNFFRIFG
jgi:hypothetical protein